MKDRHDVLPEPLESAQVLCKCVPEVLGFTTTEQAEPLLGIVGQSRALQALELGARINGDGFNIYVLGTAGSRRHQVVSQFLEAESKEKPTPFDWCYLHNFSEPHKPKGTALPPAWGARLRSDMVQLVEDLRASIPAAFEGEGYRRRLAEIEEEFNESNRQAQEALQAEAERAGLGLLPTPNGFAIAPVRDGRPMGEEEYRKLPEEERERIEQATKRVTDITAGYFERLPKLHKQRRDQMKALEKNITMLAVGSLIEDLRKRYGEFPTIAAYLDAVQEDVLENAQDFGAGKGQHQAMLPGLQPNEKEQFSRYQVNVLVDNEKTEGAPVIYESHPTFQNLLGRVEHSSQFGALVTDFTMIRPGALHRANGGYLILDIEKVLQQPYAWEGLKRAIQGKEIRIESLGQMLSLVSTQGLEPDAMPVSLKVVLIGSRLLYYLLCSLDPDFPEYFKVAADFEDRLPRSPDNLQLYGRMIAAIVGEKNLRHFESDAVARIIDESARWAGDREKLSARMHKVADLMCEADYCAANRNAELVAAQDIESAIDQQIFRQDRIRSELQESIARNTIHITTEGSAVGQVNGLSVLQLGDFAFGQPSRITATVRVGAGKVIDIEREVELGGAIHSKGVLILSSFLGSRYCSDQPLSLAASLVFEQNYGRVDGDSASVAELLALLSAICDLPIKQSYAVTGSVDQKGVVQAIGGANQKIEGFFDVCAARGLTGEQGVLIPADNVQHLMVRSDVAQAVAEAKFKIFPMHHIDHAITLLTGLDAGARDSDGQFPEGSFNYKVVKALRALAERRQAYGSNNRDGAEDKGS